jgi:hypothetical protein
MPSGSVGCGHRKTHPANTKVTLQRINSGKRLTRRMSCLSSCQHLKVAFKQFQDPPVQCDLIRMDPDEFRVTQAGQRRFKFTCADLKLC